MADEAQAEKIKLFSRIKELEDKVNMYNVVCLSCRGKYMYIIYW